jgi:hypothetical protein
MKNIVKLFLFAIIVTSIGCKNVGQETKSSDSSLSGESEIGFGQEEFDEVYHRFPSPEEMLTILQKDNLVYNGEITNDPEKTADYLDSKSQALNVGIYSADLAYLTLFKRHQESTSYFQAIYNLSTELRISAAFDMELLRRVQRNMANPDSLETLTDYAFTKISNYLVLNDKEKTFAIISIGGFVEALYLSFNFADDFSENNVIIQRIADQKLVLENIVNYSRPYMDDPAMIGALEAIKPIRKVYNKIVSVPGETNITKDENGKIIISGGNKITITKELYEELNEATIQVRKDITQN